MRLAVGTFMLFVLVTMPHDADAVPSFTWEGPWNVTLLPTFNHDPTGISSRDARAFGASATMDGQIFDTTADIATARSTAGSNGNTGVMFSRQISLSGSPQGWNVSLGGLLNGFLGAGGLATATVMATAGISPFLGVEFNRHVDFSGSNFQSFSLLNLAETHTAFVSDGLYVVSGSLVTITTPASPSGGGTSDFFFSHPQQAPVPGFQVSVSVSPIPEPSTLLLLATGLAGLKCGYRKWSAWQDSR